MNIKIKKKNLDVIIPLYNEEKCLPILINRLDKLKKRMEAFVTFNVLIVDDGSSDRSLELILEYAQCEKYIKVLSLTRNFGHQIALTAGMDHSNADYIAIIDADLQDPPELIEYMYLKTL